MKLPYKIAFGTLIIGLICILTGFVLRVLKLHSGLVLATWGLALVFASLTLLFMAALRRR